MQGVKIQHIQACVNVKNLAVPLKMARPKKDAQSIL